LKCANTDAKQRSEFALREPEFFTNLGIALQGMSAKQRDATLAVIGGQTAAPVNGRLKEIPGQVPALTNLPPGCSFAPRCAFADERCRSFYPPYEQKRPGHWAACWHSEKLYG
jgi:oligopeptide/dipeptide ABC transporter ATP-binding protein